MEVRTFLDYLAHLSTSVDKFCLVPVGLYNHHTVKTLYLVPGIVELVIKNASAPKNLNRSLIPSGRKKIRTSSYLRIHNKSDEQYNEMTTILCVCWATANHENAPPTARPKKI